MVKEYLIGKYKAQYGGDDRPRTITQDGSVNLPNWLFWLLLHRSGLVSRKRRILKKRIRRELNLSLQRGMREEG